MLHTRLCDLLNISHPILNAPMGGTAIGALAAAVSNAGGFGMIGGTSGEGPQWLRTQIRTAREKTDRPFGVGFISAFPGIADLVQVALDEGVAVINHSFADPTPYVAAAKALFTPEFFASRAGQGCLAEDPVFILGLPRAGSTLLEQILSTHSQVEGTMELPDIPHIAAQLGTIDQWPERLAAASPDDLRRMGETFLERTTIQRKTGKPFFIDKLPNNWIHVGLIHLILPNARIIDARRHPMACCFSNFKQHFARGQGFTYDLTDIGRYYADYVDLMAHFDQVLPGRVVRVFHENMVEDSAAEIRHLLDALGFPFEEACLRFWENDRAVRTASSEQVRRPIFREGTDQWRMFDPWLGELKAALGPVLTAYPAVPAI